MTEMGWQFLVGLSGMVVVATAGGILYDLRHRLDARLPSLLRADRARAQATLDYYGRVHDSSD